MRPGLILTLITALTACSQFPQLDDTDNDAARNAPFPELIPVEDIQARISDTSIEDDTGREIEARVLRLKARAARLRGTVINDASRARLQQIVN